MNAWLEILSGGRAGDPIPIETDRIRIGRDPNRDLVFPLNDGTVSAEHATIERRGQAWYLIDEESANGTKVTRLEADGETRRTIQLEPWEKFELLHGDEIVFGEGPRARFEISVPETRVAVPPTEVVSEESEGTERIGVGGTFDESYTSEDDVETAPIGDEEFGPVWEEATTPQDDPTWEGPTKPEGDSPDREDVRGDTTVIRKGTTWIMENVLDFDEKLRLLYERNKRKWRRALITVAGFGTLLVAVVYAKGRIDAREMETRHQAALETLRSESSERADRLTSLADGLREQADSLESLVAANDSSYSVQQAGLQRQIRELRSRGELSDSLREVLSGLRSREQVNRDFDRWKERYEDRVVLIEVGIGTGSDYQTLGHGTGFIVSTDGLLVTNKHVVRPEKFNENLSWLACHWDGIRERQNLPNTLYPWTLTAWLGGTRYRVSPQAARDRSLGFSSDRENLQMVAAAPDRFAARSDSVECDIAGTPHTLVWQRHAQDDNDIAILRILRDDPFVPLPTARDELPAGEPVMVYGFPAGLSPLEGTEAEPLERRGRILRVGQTIQIDATVLPGNSGGPLFDRRGRVIGITTRGPGETLNMALKIEHAQRLLNQLD